MVEVTQEDREAAADYHLSQAIGPRQSRLITAEEMRATEHDDSPLVQAFARHRIAAEQRARIEGFNEGIEAGAGCLNTLCEERATMKLPKATTGIIRQCAARVSRLAKPMKGQTDEA